MPSFKSNGLIVKFPFEPYPSQIKVIDKITESLIKSQTCLIESPTGTGKSVSILASVLAYLKQSDKQVYLCTRTHKQIEQMVKQLKQFVRATESSISTGNNITGNISKESNDIENISNSAGGNISNTGGNINSAGGNRKGDLRMSVLGSRAQLCINKTAKSSSDIGRTCSELIKSSKCQYFKNTNIGTKHFSDKIFDLEELINFSTSKNCCPFYTSKFLSEKSELILAPYNYLIDPFIRKKLNINKCHIIIDEAHNIEDNLRDSGSLSLSSKDLEVFVYEILNSKNKELYPLIELLKKVRSFRFDRKMYLMKELKVFVGKYFSQLEVNGYKNVLFSNEVELNCENKIELLLFILSNVLVDSSYILDVSISTEINNRGNRDSISTDISSSNNVISSSNRDVSNRDSNNVISNSGNGGDNWTLNFILLNVNLLFNELIKENESIILLSGTIGNINVFENELKYSFNSKLIADHVINPENLFIRKIISLKNKEIIGTKQNLSEKYFLEIVYIIEQLYSLTKGGVLVFLPSFNVLSQIKKYFKVSFFEENQNFNFAKFKNSCKTKALLLCVYRGKLSEGIDFKDDLCRLSIAIGIPYPSLDNVVVKIKKDNFSWYDNQAIKAVNQAIGRTIRHKNDYGGMVVIDTRYKSKKLSRWIEDKAKCVSYEECLEEYKKFVRKFV